MKTADEKGPDPFEHYPARVRELMRSSDVVLSIAAGQLGYGPGFEESVKNSYGTEARFWQAVLSEPLPASSFVDLIRRFHVEPHKPTSSLIVSRVARLLKMAITQRESWINRNEFAPDNSAKTLENFIVDPRRAAEWLLSMPRQRDLLPLGLQVFIGGGPDAGAPSTVTQGKRTAMHLPAAIAALRELYPEGAPHLDRKMIKRAVDQKVGHSLSARTIDRARATLWPRQ